MNNEHVVTTPREPEPQQAEASWEVVQLVTDALQSLAVEVDRLVLSSVSSTSGRAEVPAELLEAIADQARASCHLTGEAWRSVARGLRERERAKAMRVVERFL